MPDYVLLVRDEAMDPAALDRAELEALLGRFMRWTEDLHASGRLKSMQKLKNATGTTVRRRGDRVVVDGPYAEAKEAVVGFFVITADDAADIERIAAECPSVALGASVEIREADPFPAPG
jgi:hypothetical protein